MLVVDLHALEPVDVLDLVDEVLGQRLDAHHAQDVVWHRVAVHQRVAALDVVALLDADGLALGQQIFGRLGRFVVRTNDNAPFGLVVLAELDAPVDLADDGEVLGLARLEQLGDARQATGDVAGLRRPLGNAREHVARVHLGARLDRQDRVDRKQVARLHPVGELDHLALVVAQRYPGPEIRALGLLLPVDHFLVRQPGRLVGHVAHRDAVDQVDIVGDALALGDDGPRIRIPFRDALALLDVAALVDVQFGAVRHAIAHPLAALIVDQDELGVARHHHRHAVGIDDDVAVADRQLGIDRGLDARLLGKLSGASNVEGSHGELGARLADRLGGDDTDRLAEIDQRAAREIPTVAPGAHAHFGLAGQRRADLDRLDPRAIDRFDHRFVDQITRSHHDDVVQWIDDVARRAAPENAVGQRVHHFAALDDGLDGQSLLGAAIVEHHRAVLGDVDQAAGQITRIRRLERRVGESLAGAVRGVEVLQHGKAFLEVRDDRRLDDLARRLGHQAAHTGELLHLRRGTSCARVRHHVDRVDRLSGFGIRDPFHHFVGHLVGAL